LEPSLIRINGTRLDTSKINLVFPNNRKLRGRTQLTCHGRLNKAKKVALLRLPPVTYLNSTCNFVHFASTKIPFREQISPWSALGKGVGTDGLIFLHGQQACWLVGCFRLEPGALQKLNSSVSAKFHFLLCIFCVRQRQMLRAPLASHPCLGRSLLPLQRSSSSSLGQAATIETRSRQRPLQSTSSYSSASSLSSCFWSFPSISSRPLDSRTTARSSTAWTASKKNLAEISKSNGTVTSGRSSYSTSTSPTSGGERSLQLTAEERDNQVKHSGLLRYINAYRTWGHLEAKIDPLGRKERK
jgi:hypothetical protein